MPDLDEVERHLIDQIEAIKREYQKAAEPLVKELLHIQSLRPPKPFFIPWANAGGPTSALTALPRVFLAPGAMTPSCLDTCPDHEPAE